MKPAQPNKPVTYNLTAATEQDVLAAAEGILICKLKRLGAITNPSDASDFLRMRLGGLAHEEFHVLWLDNRHQILDCQKLFTGTIDGASVYPREVVRAALNVNACAAILAHNHPSGVAEPSAADRVITDELRDALRLVGVRILDHIVVGAQCVSMAGAGLPIKPGVKDAHDSVAVASTPSGTFDPHALKALYGLHEAIAEITQVAKQKGYQPPNSLTSMPTSSRGRLSGKLFTVRESNAVNGSKIIGSSLRRRSRLRS